MLVAVPLVLEAAGVVEDLKEEGDHVDWEFRGASASVVLPANRVRHVGFVVRRVEIDSVPAGWEEDLCAQPARAVEVWHLVCLWTTRPAEAVEGDSICGRVVAIAAREGVTS